MNKVITINLGGLAYQLEEQGYDALRAYLETAGVRLAGNPDRDEIVSDIERAIGEKFRALLSSFKTVVEAKEVATILAEMGPIEAESNGIPKPDASAPGPQSGSAPSEPPPIHGSPKRLYRISEGGMLGGVCNGIAAYCNIDPTFVRLAFALMAFLWGASVWAYIIMMIVIPEAVSADQKAAATGSPSTAQEYIRRAKEGYYEAMKGFPDRKARREWKRRFRQQMRYHLRGGWHGPWGEPQPMNFMTGLGLSLLSMLRGMIMLVWVCAMVTLLATGTIYGLVLPDNVPVWLVAILLIVFYCVLVGPLKFARRAYYRGSGRHGWPMLHMFDSMICLIVVAALVWLAFHFSPEVRQAVHSIPALAHQAKIDVQTWWRDQR